MGVQVSFRRTHSMDQWWEVLVDMRDGQGLTVQRPSLHRHHKGNRVYQAALVECLQLVNGVGNLDVCDLHVRQW